MVATEILPSFPKDEMYSVEVEPGKDGETGVRRLATAKDELLVTVNDEVTTCYEQFHTIVKAHGDLPFLGHRPMTDGEAGPYEFETYSKVAERVKNLAAGLVKLDLIPLTNQEGDVVDGGAKESQSQSRSDSDEKKSSEKHKSKKSSKKSKSKKSKSSKSSKEPSSSSDSETVYNTREGTTSPMRLLGLFAKNCPEWLLTEYALYSQTGVTVPLYDTLGIEAVTYMLEQTSMRAVLSANAHISTLLSIREGGGAPHFKYIIHLDKDLGEDKDALLKRAKKCKMVLYSFEHVESVGAENPIDDVPPKADDVATFCYTSGTTGMPKGAMLTHKNLIADTAAAIRAGVIIHTDDVHLSYLPLAHVFERVVVLAMLQGAGRIGFFQGDILKLKEDLLELRPTLFPSVPRLWNRFYDKVSQQVAANPFLKRLIFSKALNSKLKLLTNKNKLRPLGFGNFAFKAVRAGLGLDRCRLLVSGSAPLAGHVAKWLSVVIGCPLIEGYGMTECCAAATVTLINDHTRGHVGAPFQCNELKLVDVPEMNYLATDTEHAGEPCLGRGEVCYRGHNIFKGYFRNGPKTCEAIDKDGWLHSGDIGVFTSRGALRIVDRKKNIFKLSQGEYVAPEKVENVMARCELVAQIFVYGNSLESVLVCVVIPDEEILLQYASKRGWDGDFAALSKKDEVKTEILNQIRDMGRSDGLKGFEIPRDAYIDSELFSVDNNLLTPTFKAKRPQLLEKYKEQVDAMYAAQK